VAGDKKLYDKSLRAGLNLAWEGQWAKALEAYQKVLAEMPNDPLVHNHIGYAHLQLKHLQEALEAYHEASRLSPNDPAPLARMAEIHELSGQPHAAAAVYLSLAEVSQRQLAWADAIQALQNSVRLHPDHLPARLLLSEIYARLGQPQRASKERVSLARALQKQGQTLKAAEQCSEALLLDSQNAEARALSEALKLGEAGGEVQPPTAPALLVEEGASPVDMARDKALEELAGIPFEESPVGPAADISTFEPSAAPAETSSQPTLSRPQIDALITQAIDFQTRGLVDEAISCYTRVIGAGVDRPAAHFNLGLLYQQRLRFEQAIAEFRKSVRHPQYALGSHFALGGCYKAMGRIDEALDHLIQVLKYVDLGTVQRDQADDLVQLYDALADSYVAKGDQAKALEFMNSLVEFLSSKGWADKARDARKRIDSMADEGVTMSLVEVLVTPSATTLLSAMSLSQEYVKHGAFQAAIDVCFRAIQYAPTYLPLHLRLAEIYAQDGRIDEAVTKYMTVAEVYKVRDEKRHLIGVYKRVLRLAPMDVAVRSRLIDLLTSFGEIDQALEQYLALADAYYQLAQVNKALEKYTAALRLTPRASDEKRWSGRLLRKMAEVQMHRLNWREAAQLYQQIVQVDPEDERAWLSLIDLHYKLGQTKQADQEVIRLLDHFRSQGQNEKALALLQEAVRLQPQQMSLHARLARAYIDLEMREEAIGELDALGELQLDAGLREQARKTVQYIISLKPKNVEAYQQLLSRI
jgi:tetratricopeptide (TPR) repeat protein